VTGRTGEALAVVAGGRAALESLPDRDDLAFARVALDQAEVMALHLSGRISELEHRTAELYRHNLMAPEWAGDAIASLHRGWAALAAGRPGVALRWLVEALGGLERQDPAGVLRLCRALTAQAHALVGDAEAARLLLADLGPEPAATTVFDPQVRLAEAWLAAAEGRRPDAAARALVGAAVAAEQGQEAVEALLLHDALRFGAGGDVVDRVRRISRRVDAELLQVVALEVGATAEGAGDDLDRASHRFEELGALMWAAEAAAGGAAAYEQAGNRRAAVLSRQRAEGLARVCELSDTPALDVPAPPPLTSREEEVARLAARGLTNQDIADKLVVSVRTVEAHLAHVYPKLGITGRASLATALSSTEGTTPFEDRAIRPRAGWSRPRQRAPRPV
jgi:DNA-binding CsgD family transcriptional regulator